MRVKDIIFMGTGCSSSVPVIGCLTKERPDCKVCMSTRTPTGKKNIRRNTGLVVILEDEATHKTKTIVIDAGKTFYESALEWFPAHGLRTIDAVILTHAHADAVNGLDDLRGWTLHGFVQPSVQMYANERTIDSISKTFPYLVDKKAATGGGDLPTMVWNTIIDDEPFNLFGIDIIPLPVEHGIFFNTDKPTPYMSLGFRIGDMSYISDVSHIPEETEQLLDGTKVLVLDCLREMSFISHFGLHDSVTAARNIKPHPPAQTYLIGFSHSSDHDEWEQMCQDRYGPDGSDVAPGKPSIWVRPAYDGLRVPISSQTIPNGTS